MGIRYESISAEVRVFMRAESDLGNHYPSPRLTQLGLAGWPDLLNAAIENHTDDWLAGQLVAQNVFNQRESYTRMGKVHSRAINIPHAAQQLAEGEFNRYYIRGLCRWAQEHGIAELIVCRGKQVENPRPESEGLIGTRIPVDELLLALRTHDFVTIADYLKVPGGPNSGLTVRLP